MSDDKRRQRLLKDAKTMDVKVRRGASADEIDKAIDAKFAETHNAILNREADQR